MNSGNRKQLDQHLELVHPASHSEPAKNLKTVGGRRFGYHSHFLVQWVSILGVSVSVDSSRAQNDHFRGH